MSKKIFSLLFCLYPPHFRKRYEREILDFIGARLHSEPGIIKKALLSIELALDTLLAIPSAYRASPVANEVDESSVPYFKLLNMEPLGTNYVLVASMVSLTAFFIFIYVLNHEASHRDLSGQSSSPIFSVVKRLSEEQNVIPTPLSETPHGTANSSESEHLSTPSPSKLSGAPAFLADVVSSSVHPRSAASQASTTAMKEKGFVSQPPIFVLRRSSDANWAPPPPNVSTRYPDMVFTQSKYPCNPGIRSTDVAPQSNGQINARCTSLEHHTPESTIHRRR